ncbi:MAG TPA: hypothetical protein VEP92_11535 [Gaiellaceae bacterium]|jgi:hypothetical protein|nr:hypothetical protein [Gaiellaceae bacterium]
MPQAISVRDVSTPGNGRRVLEVTIDDLAVRVVLGAEPRSSEALLAAALAAEVAERIVDAASPAAIEISVPDRPGPAKVTRFPLGSPSSS